MKKNGGLGLNHLKRSRAEIIPQLKSTKSVAPQSIENRFIGPLDFCCLSDFSIDWESIQRLSGCCSDLLIDWESIQRISGVALISESIENRFNSPLTCAISPISWSIGNRFGCSLDSCCFSDFLIDWESIRFSSVLHPNS